MITKCLHCFYFPPPGRDDITNGISRVWQRRRIRIASGRRFRIPPFRQKIQSVSKFTVSPSNKSWNSPANILMCTRCEPCVSGHPLKQYLDYHTEFQIVLRANSAPANIQPDTVIFHTAGALYGFGGIASARTCLLRVVPVQIIEERRTSKRLQVLWRLGRQQSLRPAQEPHRGCVQSDTLRCALFTLTDYKRMIAPNPGTHPSDDQSYSTFKKKPHNYISTGTPLWCSIRSNGGVCVKNKDATPFGARSGAKEGVFQWNRGDQGDGPQLRRDQEVKKW